jgi:hypothetical protein
MIFTMSGSMQGVWRFAERPFSTAYFLGELTVRLAGSVRYSGTEQRLS